MKEYLREGLARYGPQVRDVSPCSLEQAEAYCRQLTRGHYENFSVSHFLVPRELRQHFCNLYANRVGQGDEDGVLRSTNPKRKRGRCCLSLACASG